MLNEKLPNQCFNIFKFNTTTDDDDYNNEFNIERSDDIFEPVNNKRRMEKKYQKQKRKYKKHRNKKAYLSKIKKKRLLDNEQNETKTENETDIIDDNDEDEIDPLEEMYIRITEKEPYFDIKFRGHLLQRLDNSYCVYNKNLIYISYAIVLLLIILLVLLFFLNTRKHNTLLFKILGYILTNLINIIIRPFFIAVVALLVNRPLLYLYRGTYMSSDYKTEEVI